MVAVSPFKVIIYNKSRVYQGEMTAPEDLQFTPRHNQRESGQITLPVGSPSLAALLEVGARVRVWFRDIYLMSGPVRFVKSEGVYPRQKLVFQVQGDSRILANFLGWQVPGSAITAQAASEYATYEGPAETVVKDIIEANTARYAQNVVVAPSLGRGSIITVKTRMHSLDDRLYPLVDQAGIGISVKQNDAGALVVDAYTPRTLALPITAGDGALADLSWTRTPPSVTRVVVGGPGDGIERKFRQYIDAALEAEYGDSIEELVNATDIKADDPKFEDLMSARGWERLAEGAAQAGLSCTLTESESLFYGTDGFLEGDRMKLELSPGNAVDDLIRSVTLNYNATRGMQVKPNVGDSDEHPVKGLTRALAKAFKSIREQRASI